LKRHGGQTATKKHRRRVAAYAKPIDFRAMNLKRASTGPHAAPRHDERIRLPLLRQVGF